MPKFHRGRTRYTDCVVTCEWADGERRTPPMLFTSNPLFRTDRQNTKKRKHAFRHLKKVLEKFGIPKSSVQYVGSVRGKNGIFVSESADLVRRFFKTRRVARSNLVVFSDGGNAFSENKKCIFNLIKFLIHRKYPSQVHQYLSPNDNNLHGVAKRKWKTSPYYLRPGVSSSLYFLHCLNQVPSPLIKSWFARNLMLEKESLNFEHAIKLISGVKAKSIFFKNCLSEFINFRRTSRFKLFRSNVVSSTQVPLHTDYNGRDILEHILK